MVLVATGVDHDVGVCTDGVDAQTADSAHEALLAATARFHTLLWLNDEAVSL